MLTEIFFGLKAMYICRGCGAEIAYPNRFKKCPVCGINLGN